MRRLKVVSDEDYDKLVAERRKELLDKIKDIYQQEGKAAEAVKDLSKKKE